MKKLISAVLVLVMIFSLCTFEVSYGAEEIKIIIDGEEKTFDSMPYIRDGRTLVPMRGVFETLGMEISWDDASKTVTGKNDTKKIVLTVGNQDAYINGIQKNLDVPSTVINSRTYVPLRFIAESLNCEVNWFGDERCVTVYSDGYKGTKKGMATLKSTHHRDVMTDFELSSSYDDIYHEERPSIEEQEKQYNELKSKAELVCDNDEFLKEFSVKGETYGKYEVVNVEGQSFDRALRITCETTPENTGHFIVKSSATPEKNPGDGIAKNEVLLLAFRMRTVSGGDDAGIGKIQVQIEELESGKFRKSVFDAAYAGSEWKMIYMPFDPQKNTTSIGIRPGFYKQVVEIGGFEILNFGTEYDRASLPSTGNDFPELEKGAKWRKEAFERIDNIRKGDFTVVLKDKDGKAVPDAEVELDMFEHEFQFGTAINGQVTVNEEYRKHINQSFNSAVVEHAMKWAPYEEKPGSSRLQVDAIKDCGIKNIRGHAMIWEKGATESGSNLVPPHMFEETTLNNKDVLMEKSNKHIDKIAKDFYDDVCDWDVVNELMSCDAFRKIHGNEIMIDWFNQARASSKPGTDLYYNEAICAWQDGFKDILNIFKDLKIDYDGIGLQSHYDNYFRTPAEMVDFYKNLRETYGKRLKVTEYSCNVFDSVFQANFTRDAIIAAFSEENMDGFLFWGFWQGSLYADYSPMYNNDWTLNGSGKAYHDLVYNKWWTRDAKAKTDKDGTAVINGFYGDYDVKVTHNGKEQNVMTAFHKGYENVLEIVIE